MADFDHTEQTNLSSDEERKDGSLGFSASTKLLEKRKEMMEIQNSLQQKRNEFQSRMEMVKKKEKDLLMKKQDLTENVKELDKFIGDNIIKKKRADQKKDIEQAERLKSEEEIQKCRQRIKMKEQEREYKENQLKNYYLRYQQFLQKVVQSRGEDSNPEDVKKVIDRYDTLSEKNKELVEEKNKFSKKLQREKNRLIEEKEAMKDKKVKLNHTISKLGKKLEMLIDERGKMETNFELQSSTATRDRRQIGQIEMAINNLYNRITTQGGSRIQRRCKLTVVNEQKGPNVGKTTMEVTVESYKRFSNMEVLMKMLKSISATVDDYVSCSEHIKKMNEKDREAVKKQKTWTMNSAIDRDVAKIVITIEVGIDAGTDWCSLCLISTWVMIKN